MGLPTSEELEKQEQLKKLQKAVSNYYLYIYTISVLLMILLLSWLWLLASGT
jgi:hypothetical protein